MSEARIGRIVVAALHEALADHLPLRLEFYETYLRPTGMRAGTIGVASFTAALSFLRAEGDAYEPVVRRAGGLAAEWLFASQPAPRRVVWRWLPQRLRARVAMTLAARLARLTVVGASGRLAGRRGDRRLLIAGSPFCGTRHRVDAPLCGFYAAALQRFFDLLDVGATADAVECRAAGAGTCVVRVAAAAALPVAAHAPTGRLLS